MKSLRWALIIPAALLISFVVHMIGTIAQGMAMGFEEASSFWAASDMQGKWLSGTLMIAFVRFTSGAASTLAVVLLAPSHKILAVRVWIAIIALGAVAAIVFAVLNGSVDHRVGFWYRSVLETIALIGGASFMSGDILLESTTR